VCSASGSFPTIFKVDSNGFYKWGHLTPMVVPYSIKCTLDGGFIVVGWTGSLAGWAVEKYDSSGAGQWGKYYGSSSTIDIDDRFRDIIQLPDSDFIVSGSAPLSLAKLNHINGDTIWTRNFGIWANSVAYTYDHNLIVADESGSIYKYDTSGLLLWYKNFSNISLQDIKTTYDGGFVAVGAYFGSISQVLLIKTDSLGNVSSLIGIDENNIMQSISNVFPNPVTNTSQLNFLNPKNETWHFSVSDITGRVSEEKETTGSTVVIEKGNKPQGVYFYSLFNTKTGERVNGKFVVQ
jgi:hypothetical protein